MERHLLKQPIKRRHNGKANWGQQSKIHSTKPTGICHQGEVQVKITDSSELSEQENETISSRGTSH